jgi:hypothetical protein
MSSTEVPISPGVKALTLKSPHHTTKFAILTQLQKLNMAQVQNIEYIRIWPTQKILVY